MKENELIEIWGDNVNLKSMIVSMLICITTSLAGYFLAINYSKTLQLFFGILGATIGFVLSVIFIKPKRIIKGEE